MVVHCTNVPPNILGKCAIYYCRVSLRGFSKYMHSISNVYVMLTLLRLSGYQITIWFWKHIRFAVFDEVYYAYSGCYRSIRIISTVHSVVIHMPAAEYLSHNFNWAKEIKCITYSVGVGIIEENVCGVYTCIVQIVAEGLRFPLYL